MIYYGEKMVKRNVAKRFRLVAKLLEERGWCKGQFHNSKGEHCLIGGLNVSERNFKLKGTDGAATVLLGWLRENKKLPLHYTGAGVISYNDVIANSRDEVTSALRACAADLEHGWTPQGAK